MRLLVCGGRNYGEIPDGCPAEQIRHYSEKAGREVFLLRETLGHLFIERNVNTVITGGARGADSHAFRFARQQGRHTLVFKADWSLGKKAGPVRNQKMIDEGRPDLVLAFPGGKGTADMVRRARETGIEVMEVGEFAHT
jgi:predicted Rossmann-fold nucleotide-binding protein